MKKLNHRALAAAALAIGLQAHAAIAQPVNLWEPTRKHRPDLDRMRKAEEKRQRKAAARRFRG